MSRFKKSKEQHKQLKETLSDDIRTVLRYDFNIVNSDTGLSTIVKQMPLKKIIELLKTFETVLKENVRDGNANISKHRNSKLGSKKVTKV